MPRPKLRPTRPSPHKDAAMRRHLIAVLVAAGGACTLLVTLAQPTASGEPVQQEMTPVTAGPAVIFNQPEDQ